MIPDQGGTGRLQLFGDTLAEAAHLERLSSADQVYLSKSTAELLISAGKSNWIKPPSAHDGEEKTYVLALKSAAHSEKTGHMFPPNLPTLDSKTVKGPLHETTEQTEKIRRLIDWNYEMLLLCLKNIVAQRAGSGRVDDMTDCARTEAESRVGADGPPLSEVVEVLQLTDFMLPSEQQQSDAGSIELDGEI